MRTQSIKKVFRSTITSGILLLAGLAITLPGCSEGDGRIEQAPAARCNCGPACKCCSACHAAGTTAKCTCNPCNCCASCPSKKT
ncbi:MAG: hypothetical protein MI923_28165 [Phycisphaerales bacterium]|nr:hypothetical protein [Phycisphaerales bacterium]